MECFVHMKFMKQAFDDFFFTINMGRAMRKRAIGNMRTAKAHISLRMRSLIRAFAVGTESSDSIECFNGEQMPGWDFADVQNHMNPHILRMLEGTCVFKVNIVQPSYSSHSLEDTKLANNRYPFMSNGLFYLKSSKRPIFKEGGYG